MLQDYSYEDRFAWILRKKEEGSQLCKDQKYKEAIDIWMQAMCGYEFGKYKKDKKTETESQLKIPIVNNMALSFMMLANEEPNMRLKYLEKANGLLEQILKIDPKNEKALLRKCGVLVDLGGLKECEELLERLNVIAFDSAKSQAVYMEIKKIKQRMEDKKNGNK